MRWFIGLLQAITVGVVLVAGVVWFWWDNTHAPLQFGEETVVYEVKPGASIRSVAIDFESRQWLSSRWWLETWARFKGQASNIRAGEYRLNEGMSVEQVLDLFVSGQSLQYRITFPEGITTANMVQQLQANEQIEATLDTAKLQQELEAITGHKHSEGWFYPDTYQFPKGATDRDVLTIAHKKMQKELAAAWSKKSVDVILKTPYDALILASIVEKETGVAEERPMIAGVFTQRLKKGMRLQTDPTVIYGMGKRYKGNIRKSDLKRDTPYNTYTRTGLTPTPIALPGREALLAAVNPEETDALFFVAKGGGYHHFSKTYKEHRRAVIKYQLGGNASRYQGDK